MRYAILLTFLLAACGSDAPSAGTAPLLDAGADTAIEDTSDGSDVATDTGAADTGEPDTEGDTTDDDIVEDTDVEADIETDTGDECGELETPDPGPCLRFDCEPVDPPLCWDCVTVADNEGGECTTEASEAGTCQEGTCVASGSPLDPASTGPYAVTDQTIEWFSDGESVDLTIVQPEGVEGPLPTVVFMHGFQLSTSNYASYGRHLASWGYLVAMPTFESSLLFPTTHATYRDHLIALINQMETDIATPGQPMSQANLDALALAGHSLGGKLSLLVATSDDRVDAIFAIDPVDAAGGPLTSDGPDYPSVTPELMGEVDVPMVLVGEITNASCTGFGCQACAPADNNFQQYYAHADSPVLEIEMVGANHMSFLDDPNCGFTCSVCDAGTDDPATTRRLTQRYFNAFLDVELRGDTRWQGYLNGAAMQPDIDAGLIEVRVDNGF